MRALFRETFADLVRHPRITILNFSMPVIVMILIGNSGVWLARGEGPAGGLVAAANLAPVGWMVSGWLRWQVQGAAPGPLGPPFRPGPVLRCLVPVLGLAAAGAALGVAMVVVLFLLIPFAAGGLPPEGAFGPEGGGFRLAAKALILGCAALLPAYGALRLAPAIVAWANGRAFAPRAAWRATTDQRAAILALALAPLAAVGLAALLTIALGLHRIVQEAANIAALMTWIAGLTVVSRRATRPVLWRRA